ncbi:hypothetical protein [Flavobacterium wongokense]|uniref:hypothetical protein n=1 Tax=Flavobacterium wongokense TaxID=2910674 RepID=UPI001F21C542|nr:hypothetical protein [Flavobacterium sp. WG47]MCF6132752.1 hypothetical protein [Flavobacterium sp. WG47]
MGQELNTAISKGIGSVMPAYNANPYDNAGQVYDELFSTYYDGTVRLNNAQSVINQVETIAQGSSSFLSIATGGYAPLSVERINYLAEKRNSDIGAIIGASSLSPHGKTSFANFLISFVALYESDADAISMFNAVIKYEDSIIGSTLLPENDKRILLTTTSIVRYSSYRAKKRPKKNTDPDWIISVGHAFGTEEGAEENMAKAIVEGLVTGIVSNK